MNFEDKAFELLLIVREKYPELEVDFRFRYNQLLESKIDDIKKIEFLDAFVYEIGNELKNSKFNHLFKISDIYKGSDDFLIKK